MAAFFWRRILSISVSMVRPRSFSSFKERAGFDGFVASQSYIVARSSSSLKTMWPSRHFAAWAPSKSSASIAACFSARTVFSSSVRRLRLLSAPACPVASPALAFPAAVSPRNLAMASVSSSSRCFAAWAASKSSASVAARLSAEAVHSSACNASSRCSASDLVASIDTVAPPVASPRGRLASACCQHSSRRRRSASWPPARPPCSHPFRS
mmetsp:Transcript_55446/g.154509  ORF Transcript_55446/g.154509 Transcript_55446/m.154509 type:complete len:211 (+) Transcript_55446:266-898(+)